MKRNSIQICAYVNTAVAESERELEFESTGFTRDLVKMIDNLEIRELPDDDMNEDGNKF